jgi:dipeptidyl aminopeptidase/acylaminoacyl peptidase
MKKSIPFLVLLILGYQFVFAQSFTIEQISSYPFPSELTTSQTGNSIAWAMNEQGLRNIYISQEPDYTPKKITSFDKDDGQEITSLQFSNDGKFIVFVRGGEHGSNWNYDIGINPASETNIPNVAIWKVSLENEKAEMLTDGDNPIISPDSKTIAFLKNRQIWIIPVAEGKASQHFEAKGSVNSFQWSPDGKQILFELNRGTHSLIGIFSDHDTPIQWIEPSFHRDVSPKWSLDGKMIAFVRLPGGKSEPHPILAQRHSPWEIWVADVASGRGSLRWKSPETLMGSVPTTHGRFNLHWAANNELVYLSYEDGWPHLYAMDPFSGPSKQLTKGQFMVEHISLSPDKSKIFFSANTGSDQLDIDRRHIGMVNLKEDQMVMLTEGEGIEAIPAALSDNQKIAFFSATSQRPMVPAILDIPTKEIKLIAADLIPSDFPDNLVVPQQVIFKSPDGMVIHGQIFEKPGGSSKKPGIVFVHGGPQRQMLLGWHYGDYYTNTYAVNQYLAEMGFVVLSVNFRLGIGYGYEFHKAPRTYWQGAEEYLDVKAAGEYLASLENVDENRIGIYGGSYGGYLTALALGKDSGLFKVGVDIHGVHELSSRLKLQDGFEQAPDYTKALKIAWLSSPLAYLDTWTSPVLFIHGDDDRNVQVSQTTDLIRRFDEKKKPYEYLIIPDDSHHWMKHSNLIKVNKATVEFLNKHLNQK